MSAAQPISEIDGAPDGGRILIGTAGWSIPRASAQRVGTTGTHLERYARLLDCAEINSSFYRPHSFKTYAKWAAATSPGFRFAIKLPRTITHEQKLRRARLPLERFLGEISGLGEKRGPILVQLPPSLAFDARVAGRFLECLRARCAGPIVCEPRHPSWFAVNADRLLQQYQVARVAADPPRAAGGGAPGGWTGIVYFRLHGSPRPYWSRYSAAAVAAVADALHAIPRQVPAWCVFDNTASGAAIENAWELQAALGVSSGPIGREPMPADDPVASS